MTAAAPLMEKINAVKSLSISKCPKEPVLTKEEQPIRGALLGSAAALPSPGPSLAWHVPLAMACVPCQLLGDTGQGAAPWDAELPQGHSTLLPRAHALSHLESYSLKTPSKFSLENRGEGRNNGYSRTKGEKD